jgi:two-component system phosphate regulon response regulator PhoB
MTAKILVIEDEVDIRNLIKLRFEKEGFQILAAGDGEAGRIKALNEAPDLIVLDLMLPKKDGLTLCKELKNTPATQSIPILMLTAKSEEVDRILGFELGADDYLTKPFSVRELVLRVRAILNRAKKKPEETAKPLSHSDLVLDPATFETRIKGRDVNLTKTEFHLLRNLLLAKGRVVTKEYLLNKIWGFESYGDSRTLDTHMAKLRKKIGKYGDYIETVRGVGYKFVDSK